MYSHQLLGGNLRASDCDNIPVTAYHYLNHATSCCKTPTLASPKHAKKFRVQLLLSLYCSYVPMFFNNQWLILLIVRFFPAMDATGTVKRTSRATNVFIWVAIGTPIPNR